MKLNNISPAAGSRKPRLRVGRGASAGQGKTCGRGVKGQRARKGGYHKVGFEGGQMPIQRRLPKVGFRSKVAPLVAEVRLNELARIEGGVIDLASLKRERQPIDRHRITKPFREPLQREERGHQWLPAPVPRTWRSQ